MISAERIVRYTAISLWSVGVVFLCACLFPPHVHAQLGLSGIENSLSVRMEPQYPAPGDTVTLRASDPVIDLSQADIVWKSAGKIIAEGRGIDSTQVLLGGLGSKTDIEVTAQTTDDSASRTIRITPTDMDLLVDSDAYTPPFYRGRALPSVGSTVHLEAKPHFIQSNGTQINDRDIMFVWRKNNEPMSGLSGLGKSSAQIPVQHLYGNDVISVEAYTENHAFANLATYTIVPTNPIVLLYQNHPLWGILYHHALEASPTFSENEVTFSAVPYFASSKNANDPSLIYDWRVNGQKIAASAVNPSSITINADNSTGVATLQLGLSHATNYFLDAQNSWDITLSARQKGPSPFGSFNQ